ncbi:Endonuclease V [Chryseolinea serpens]|uniref:Endonuclease V n=1 Tax=Chryseolinea serpens TaxID=947013 RepID=A0A1M5XPM0_9BACT|nr:endonuclease V [Chryseolinea serpens]SHI01484.1 Endonuclease V [Chryseolinea serpens]
MLSGLKLAIDVYYRDEHAKAVGLQFRDWTDDAPLDIKSVVVNAVLPYEPGNFYKRELPCILALLALFDITTIDTLIVDGYVYLNDDGKPGLGAHLYEALDQKIAVVGVAKTSFHDNARHVVTVTRQSKNPLFVSAVGMRVEVAAENVRRMHGPFRMPTLLKMLDQETRKA